MQHTNILKTQQEFSDLKKEFEGSLIKKNTIIHSFGLLTKEWHKNQQTTQEFGVVYANTNFLASVIGNSKHKIPIWTGT